MVACSAGIPESSPAHAVYKAIEELGASYLDEQALLREQRGWTGRTYGPLFQYTVGSQFEDWLRRNQIGTRSLGAVEGTASLFGAAGTSIIAGGCLGSGNVLCAAAGGAATLYLTDHVVSGYRTAIQGELYPTMLQQAFIGAGVSPEHAAMLDAAAGILVPAAALKSGAALGLSSPPRDSVVRAIPEAPPTSSRSTLAPGMPDFYVRPNGDVVPSKGFRAIGGAENVKEAMAGAIGPRATGPTYVTFDDITNLSKQEVKQLLQLPREPTHAATFDTLQLLDDLRIPTGRWNTLEVPEPVTRTFPEWGSGGGSQSITNSVIRIDRINELNASK